VTTKEEFTSLRSLVNEVLAGDIIDLRASSLILEELPDENQCKIQLKLYPTGGGAPSEIEGLGVGVVDATFHAVKDALVSHYPSLQHIYMKDFRVYTDAKTGREDTRMDALGTVQFEIRNEEERIFRFEDSSRSITASAVRVVLNAVSHFINAERAVRNMVVAIEDARSRNRGGLVDSYTMKLSELVKHASYQDVVRDAQKR
jgi:hypothetical protein